MVTETTEPPDSIGLIFEVSVQVYPEAA